MKMHSIVDFLGVLLVKAFGLFLCATPLPIALWIGRRAGDLAYLTNLKRRAIAYANLKSSFPEKRACEIKRILRSHYKNLGMSIIELLKMPVMGKRYLDRYVSIENMERIKEALDRQKGVIFLTAHFGNWEIASLAAASRGYRMSLFAREQKYARLNSLLNRYREMEGSNVVAKGFSAREIIKTLKANGIVAVLGDQDAGPNGVFIDFLGRPASVAPGAVIFGLNTGAAVLTSFIRRVGYSRHVTEIGRPLELLNTGDKEKDVRINLEKTAPILEDYIRRFPDQWLWSHKRWKTTPQRTVLVLSDGKPGHLNQGLAVAEMIKEALGSRLKARSIDEKPIVKIHALEVKFKSRLTRAILDLTSFFAGHRCQGCLTCMKACLEEESFRKLKDQYADIIVSCGASTVAANIFLRHENNAKNIVMMKPGPGRARKFDLVILPRHDTALAAAVSPDGRTKGERSASNILITEAAPNLIREATPDRTTEAAPNQTGDHKSKVKDRGLGLLIGGDAKNFRLEKAMVEKVVDASIKIADEMSLDLFVSSSRRTSPEIDALLKDRLENHRRCKLLVIANEKNIENALSKIFSMTSLLIVSPESMSMVSEAASSGRYTVVFGARALSKKYARAIENLEKRGYIRNIEPDDLYNTVKKILLERPAVKIPDDRAMIIQRLSALL